MALSERQKAATTGDNLGEGESIKKWSPLRRTVFRFVCVYLVVYNLPFPLNILPQGFPLYDNFWSTLTLWTGRHVFHRAVVAPNGSGDTSGGWVQVFICLAAALLATAFWTVLDRRRPHYDRLYDWLRVYVRFALASVMISYGAMKIFPNQFPVPSLDRLSEPFGDASPMGLMWTFMGASPAYEIFGGLLEMLGGLLLTTRHTTLLGALVCMGVLSNVVALNFCYDVPVKLLSAHLLLMALFLAAPYVGRLIDLFVRGRAVGPTPLHRLFQDRRLDRAALVLRTLFVAGLAGMALWQNYQIYTSNKTVSHSPLYGLWAVDQWNVNGVTRPPLVTDTAQWHRVALSHWGLTALTVSGTRQHYFIPSGPVGQTVTLKRSDDPAWSSTLTYTQPKPDSLLLAGTLDGRQLRVRLHHEDAQNSLLIRRGFHWVNEFPYNR